jgi:hypothetical protein
LPLETYSRPGQFFDDDPEGYIPLPEDISRLIGRKRRRSRSGGGDDHLSKIMDEFVIPNKDKSWLHLQEIKELENQEREDKSWDPKYKYTPCFERNTESVPKEGKALKIFKRGTSCGEEAEKGRKFKWSRAHLLVARKPSYDAEGDESTSNSRAAQVKFINAAFQVCKSSFRYHCSRPGTTQGIGAGYFMEAWGEATSIGLLIADCGKQTEDADECGFVVLGFCFLRDYSGHVEDKFKRQKVSLADAIETPHQTPFPEYAMYIDIICSKISTAQNLMKLFTQPSKASEQKWKRVVFDEDAEGKSHYVLLRAIPSVYTYYPIMYGFTRSMDNVKMNPIFKVRQDEIVNMLLSQSEGNRDLLALSQRDLPTIATEMFGSTGWDIKESPRQPPKLRVYELPKAFFTFIKKHNLASEVAHVFVPTKYVCGDSDSNGYLYALYVAAH